tara:strand:- start:267 stop:524 length:258 start_codon:yes stop_codon:yes gene_type:complete
MLRKIWNENGEDALNKSQFKIFFIKLGINITDDEIGMVFDIIDLEKRGHVTFNDVKIFLTMTKVYDRDKYPPKRTIYTQKNYKNV